MNLSRTTRNSITYLVGVALIVSQVGVQIAGGEPSAVLVGAGLMVLGVPVADALDRRRNGNEPS